jgi:hypothetical protein
MSDLPYNRWVSSHPYSLALSRFRRDFTTLNNYYWGAAASASAVGGKLRHITDDQDFRSELGLNAPRFQKPLGQKASVFAEQVTISQEWHRRAVLVMLASAFERYLASVATTAIASNPTLSRAPHLLDGLALLKYDVQTVKPDVVDVVKGTWSSRVAAFGKLFGANAVLHDSISAFERLREDRNAIAHSFGTQAPADVLSPHVMLLLGAGRTSGVHKEVKVTEARLVSLFEKVHGAVEAVDRQLMADHIGSYEPAALYLEWKQDPQSFESAFDTKLWDSRKAPERNAKRFLTFVMSAGVSVAYVRSLEKFLVAL